MMIDLERISRAHLETEPYRWAAIDELFSPQDAAALAATFPRDHFKRLEGHDGEKAFAYEVRGLIPMGARSVSRARRLSGAWRALADELLSPAYRTALSTLTGLDLSAARLEVNIFDYPPGGTLEAHPDHRSKIVTHVMYLNESWNDDDGGCLTILRSSDPRDIAARISPRLANSAVLVRSDDSWHAVGEVVKSCRRSRRSVTATFYGPGDVSTLWPRWDRALRHAGARRWRRLWGRLGGSAARLGEA